jgi:hypothetical protein
MSQQGIEPRPPPWEASILAKSYSNSVVIAIQNFYILARDIVAATIYKSDNPNIWYYYIFLSLDTLLCHLHDVSSSRKESLHERDSLVGVVIGQGSQDLRHTRVQGCA